MVQAHCHGFRFRFGQMIGSTAPQVRWISPPPSTTKRASSRRHASSPKVGLP